MVIASKPLTALLLAQCARSDEMRERYARQIVADLVEEVIEIDTQAHGRIWIQEAKDAGLRTQCP